MLAILSMSHWVLFGINLGLAIVALIALAFILFVVMKQSGNSDGTEAFSGGSKNSEDDAETYYGKNAGSNSEAKLKKWTYISAIVLAVCCIAMVILQAINWN